MSLDNESLVNQINSAADVVAEQHGEYQAALADESTAEAELLKAVIEKARKALPALGSRVKTFCYAPVEGPGRKDTFAPWQGLYIDRTGKGKQVGPTREGASRNNRGPFVGTDYFLVTKHPDKAIVGQFAEVEYRGSWTCWMNEADQWKAEIRFISLAETLETLELGTVLRELSAALTAQLQGKKPERTKQAARTAEQLRALVTLL